MNTIANEFLVLQRALWDLKQSCSDDPESAQAIRNGVYMSVAHKVELIANQVYAERARLQKRIAELETQLASVKQEWILTSDRLPALDQQDTDGEVNSMPVLVCLKSGMIELDRAEALVGGRTTWWRKYGINVSAWMPLPEPLK